MLEAGCPPQHKLHQCCWTASLAACRAAYPSPPHLTFLPSPMQLCAVSSAAARTRLTRSYGRAMASLRLCTRATRNPTLPPTAARLGCVRACHLDQACSRLTNKQAYPHIHTHTHQHSCGTVCHSVARHHCYISLIPPSSAGFQQGNSTTRPARLTTPYTLVFRLSHTHTHTHTSIYPIAANVHGPLAGWHGTDVPYAFIWAMNSHE